MAAASTAVTMLPLVDAVSLNFTAPIFVTIMASLILRETVRLRRWTAVAIGFGGMLVIVRPGFQEFNLGHLLVMGDAIIWAAAVILVRILSRREPPIVIVSHMFVWVTPLSLIPTLFVWVWPSPQIWLWMVAMAACSTVGHILATRALAAAEASAVMPFDYIRLIFFASAGYLFFGELPDEWTLVGAAIIVASSLYIMRREAIVARQRAAAERMADGAEDDN
ncbi:MAG: DMT family transporter [Rhodospirillaceae bacterium]|nr:DMT family transporter [Rhodospirillaceae bacterium]